MLSSASDPSTFPNSVLVEASKDLRKDPDERKLWTLAKDGWRKVLIDHRDRILNRYIGRFHTPEPVQIDELFEKLIGINTLSKCWYWRKTTASGASERLAQLVRLRHQIAHRVRTDKAVHMKDLIRGGLLIQRLAVKSSNRLRTYLHSKTGVYPWGQFQYRNTS
jgi:hypothetical protein